MESCAALERAGVEEAFAGAAAGFVAAVGRDAGVVAGDFAAAAGFVVAAAANFTPEHATASNTSVANLA